MAVQAGCLALHRGTRLALAFFQLLSQSLLTLPLYLYGDFFLNKLSIESSFASGFPFARPLLLAGCGSGVTDAQKQAAVERCVAKQSGKQGSTDIQGHATPEMRAAIEQAAQQANAELAKINRQMCEKTVTETCKQSSGACKKLVSEG